MSQYQYQVDIYAGPLVSQALLQNTFQKAADMSLASRWFDSLEECQETLSSFMQMLLNLNRSFDPTQFAISVQSEPPEPAETSSRQSSDDEEDDDEDAWDDNTVLKMELVNIEPDEDFDEEVDVDCLASAQIVVR